MKSVIKEFEHLKIPLEELKEATNDFDDTKIIGVGGFGNVYGGEITHSKGRSMVAIKRLSRKFGQGDPEFWKEVMMLSRYTHTNLISLLGYCDEDGEKILVYEYATNGSLDRHLSSTTLTWLQRLKICLDVAMGLAYLHDHKGTQQRVVHRDIKSANILLYDNWNAKLSDLGLSKLGPANQQHTVLFTHVAGTPGYCDPQYMEMYALTKESDIYSFGVVLFEVLCGKLCVKKTNGRLEVLVPMWKQSYIDKKLNHVMLDLSPPLNPVSLEIFSSLAFQCLHNSREQRPITSFLIERLWAALERQGRSELKVDNLAGTCENYVDEVNCVVGTSQKSSYVDEAMNDYVVGTSQKSSYVDEAVKDDVVGTSQISSYVEVKNVVGTSQKSNYVVDGMSTLLSKGKGVFLNWSKSKNKLGLKEKDGAAEKRAADVGRRKFVHFMSTMGFTADDLFNGKAESSGKGSYGAYYEVTLKNGDHVTVYNVKKDMIQNHREIDDGLNFLGKLRHPNLLELRAYSLEPNGNKILVYEYINFFSLTFWLHGPTPMKNWPKIMNIAKGVTRGLHALHTHNIVHGNLTSNNILVGQYVNIKISDFGLSRFMTAVANSEVLAKAWTLGYQDPQLFELEEADTKTDVYSLGVIMLELLTGKSPKDEDLVSWVTTSIRAERSIELVIDHYLLKDASADDEQEMMNTLQLACDCVSNRPDVHLVLQKLEEIRPETTDTTFTFPGLDLDKASANH
ncbi:hypothetical protein QVD17_26258 [Tagetes erecta]|uniref:Protein kinase domain-containing protein n=1 Tax=Tagetes erecta TaxID=13708 RepID=A0AAD8NQM9_TARER|nr:hypothetical protein QVD17_26258 [Tagetes erecta]